jgi:hypothetical protein
MYAMFGILFIFALGLKDELLEDVVIPCDNTEDSTPISTPENTCRRLKIRDEPNLERAFIPIVGNVFSSRYLKLMYC